MAATSSGVYDFMSTDNSEQWKGLLQPALRKVSQTAIKVRGLRRL